MTRLAFRLTVVLALTGALAAPARAQDWLPDSSDTPPPATPSSSSTGRLLVDVGLDKSDVISHANLGIDGRIERYFGAAWSVHGGGRLDRDAYSQHTPQTERNALSLRELFARHESDDTTIDVGRMNLLEGVAYGYNPSDLFRTGALPIQRTRDPRQLRDSRLGVVALRAAVRANGHDLSLVATPSLHVPSDPEWYDPRWGAVNDGLGQLLLKWAPPRWEDVYTNLLAQRLSDGRRSLGVNVTSSVGSAWVAYAEVARTERPQLVALASNALAEPEWLTQSTLGLSFSTESRQTLTLEWQHNGAGLSRDDWLGVWQQAPADGLGRAFTNAGKASDPLGRDNVMVALQWDQLGSVHADLNVFARFNLVDSSRLGWIEWRYRQPSAEWSMNLTLLDGGPRSEFGAAGQRWNAGLRWRYYL